MARNFLAKKGGYRGANHWSLSAALIECEKDRFGLEAAFDEIDQA